jgi:anionic cell wall polymer biosynthesis LytR-Cps2A-Psr (LCP) family protein
MPPSDQQGGSEGPGDGGERPEYRVYRSRPGFLSRLRAPDLASLRERLRGERKPSEKPPPAEPARKRRWVRWVLLAIVGWLLLSFLAFAVSAQIQKSKLDDAAGNELGGNPFLLADPQTILVIGTDARTPGSDDVAEIDTSEECLDQQASGEAPHDGCPGFRADTLMLVRAGGGAFRKLSIPRDSVAEIPGIGVGKINAAYANGGASLQVRAVEQFLQTEIDHVVIVDFEGFQDFIDAIGGVEIEVDDDVEECVGRPDRPELEIFSEISGGGEAGGFTLALEPGEHTLDGVEALAFARVRSNQCDPSENDLDRAARQQELLSGIKGRLTDPLRLPINFIKGPIIGWTAPRAFVSDFGALTMPQLVLASIIGGDSDTEILEPSGTDAAGNLIISDEERRQAVDKLLDG